MTDILTELNEALAGRYRIERELGEGGMAVVYLATDLKHNRQVAIKVLRPELAAAVGEDRFLAEIQTTAGLQHPNILPLFDSGAADGYLFYAMPYVQGETLREKLKREVQLPVEDAVELIQKVAAALSYAHEQGVVHRDIKPANILLSSGEPLVADFGIALAVSRANDGRRTETGLSLGTPHYMSPEQASGDRSLDPRSDIYALGCVLHELLTGEPPFPGANAQAILARILTTRPTPVTSLRPTVPPHVDSVIAKSMEKLPADRFSTATAFRKALNDTDFRHTVVEHTMGTAAQQAQPRVVHRRTHPGVFAGIGAAALIVGLLGGATILGGGTAESAGDEVYRLDLDLSAFEAGSGPISPVLSSDGRYIAIGAQRDGTEAIWLRRTDEPDFVQIPNTEGGSSPTFSPDGQWIAFTHRRTQQLRKVTLSGGGLMTLLNVDSIRPFYPHWGTQDQIVITGPQGPFIVSATSGSPEDLIRVTGASAEPDPFLLPDGRGVLISESFGDNGIEYIPVGQDTSWTVIPNGANPIWLSTGHILYTSPDGGGFAVAFDLESGQATGSPVRVLDRVAGAFGRRSVSFAPSGQFVYAEGPVDFGSRGGATPSELVILDPDTGDRETLPITPGPINDVSPSPDGRFLVFVEGQNDQVPITYDILTGDREPLAVEGNWATPLWSPDGEWIVVTRVAEGTGSSGLMIGPADGRSPPDSLLLKNGRYLTSTDWTEDGTLLFSEWDGTDLDMWAGRLERTGDSWELVDVQPYLTAEWMSYDGTRSPSGDLVLHLSDRGASDQQVFISSWPEPTMQRPATSEDTCCITSPRWTPDGDAIVYQLNQNILRMEVLQDPLRVMDPETLGSIPFLRELEMLPDGRLLLRTRAGSLEDDVSDEEEPQEADRYLMVVNWRAELLRKLEELGG